MHGHLRGGGAAAEKYTRGSILQLLGNGLSLFRQNIIALTNEVEAMGKQTTHSIPYTLLHAEKFHFPTAKR
ncbi:unnamed protein product, partial [Ceratitis capitata]